MRSATKFFCVLSLLAGASSARAQASRTWVSGVGDDANPCSRTAPCKTFPGAISKTAVGGEIDALDPGGFGAVTITKSITLDGSGTFASILASNGNGVNINIAAGNGVVILRGLSINGIGTGASAVRIANAGSVTIERCALANFATAGVDDERTGAGLLFIKNSTIINAVAGVIVGGNAAITATISKSSMLNGTIGLHALGSAVSNINISDSVFAGNSGHGLLVELAPILSMDQGAIVGNGIGAEAAGTARFSRVLFSDNATGVTGSGSFTFGNNPFAGNTTNGSFTNIVAPQ